jgi:hypothetical protein
VGPPRHPKDRTLDQREHRTSPDLDAGSGGAPLVPPAPTQPAATPDGPRAVTAESLPYLTERIKVRTGRSRQTLAWLGGLGALLLILALAAWGVTQRDAAEDAREQSQVWQTEVGQLNETLAATRTELQDAEAQATSLAAQTEALRVQLQQVGGQLEQTETETFLVAGERESLREIAQRGPGVAADMRRCADARNAVAQRALELTADPPPPRNAFDAAVGTANQVCAQANDALARLEQSVAEIDQPPAGG